jgi:hypothetical protein
MKDGAAKIAAIVDGDRAARSERRLHAAIKVCAVEPPYRVSPVPVPCSKGSSLAGSSVRRTADATASVSI